MITDQQADLHRLNLPGSRPKSFLSTLPGIRYESWVYSWLERQNLYCTTQCPGLAAVDIHRKAVWKPSELQWVLRSLAPHPPGQCHSHLYFVSRHGKTKGLSRLSKTKRRNWSVSQSFRIIFQPDISYFTRDVHRGHLSQWAKHCTQWAQRFSWTEHH